ncbi:hypothetical protein EVAR_95107_1 [Eumeta japonica]|uniref:Uncharacterized protein n=1 Tax=Eumeta variegata TaxID=151549 RepID=A0A4C1TB67_EUMVA|nr:hypothetical protein EVAR_95107_1 [Eumeta japonica]
MRSEIYIFFGRGAAGPPPALSPSGRRRSKTSSGSFVGLGLRPLFNNLLLPTRRSVEPALTGSPVSDAPVIIARCCRTQDLWRFL